MPLKLSVYRLSILKNNSFKQLKLYTICKFVIVSTEKRTENVAKHRTPFVSYTAPRMI